MRETKFIQSNKEKWERFEALEKTGAYQPEELSKLYASINDDLSYAKTFYERRTVRAYLNHLAQKVILKINHSHKEPARNILNYFAITLPLEIYRARKNFLLAFTLFLFYALIGALSTHVYPDFAKTVLGSGYVDLTEKNIAEGNPLGIYGDSGQAMMFWGITLNNITVALLCFLGGIFFGVFTHIILFKNAVMVGVFQYFFQTQGLLYVSFLGIWIHGAFEISAIIVASGAGLTIGNALLFPGKHARLASFQFAAKRGIRIMLSLIPVFVIAGFLESYVTRNYQVLGDATKWTIIILSFAIMLFYYVFFPMYVAHKNPALVEIKQPIGKPKNDDFKVKQALSFGELIQTIFQFYLSNFRKVLRPIFNLCFPIILLIIGYQIARSPELLYVQYNFDWAAHLSILFGNYNGSTFTGIGDFIATLTWIPILCIIYASTFYAIGQSQGNYQDIKFTAFLRKYWKIWIGGILLTYPLFYLLPYYAMFFLPLLFPIFFMQLSSKLLQQEEKVKKHFWQLVKDNFFLTLGVVVFLSLVVFCFSQPIAFVLSIEEANGQPIMRDLLDIVSDFLLLQLQFYFSGDTALLIANLVRMVIYATALLLILPVFFIAAGFIFLSAQEKQFYFGLKKSIQFFGKRSNIRETKYDYHD